MSARGGFTCYNLVLCAPRSIWMFGMLLLLAVAPSSSLARSSMGLTLLAYEVSPPPATRGVMPSYLPRISPKDAQPMPLVAADRRAPPRISLRARFSRGHHRPHRVRSCKHCHHGRAGSGATRQCRQAGDCGHPGKGHIEERHERRRLSSPPEHRQAHSGTNQPSGHRGRDCNGVRSCRAAGERRRWYDPRSFLERLSISSGSVQEPPPASPSSLRSRTSMCSHSSSRASRCGSRR
jgi:hypothetical protein